MTDESTPTGFGNAKTMASPPPDWARVPFAVRCARCGADLKGRSEPTCPACGLEFDWADAVPIEELTCLHCDYHLYGLEKPRCPECGEWFAWEEVLHAYRTRSKPFFEYQWRSRPVRSFARSWMAALRPRKFWSEVELHDPVQVRPLIAMVFIGVVLFAASMVVSSAMVEWLEQRTWLWAPQPKPSVAQIPLYLLHSMTDPSVYTITATAAVWIASSLAALMILRQSMRRCRVRNAHVLRVWAYSTTLMAPTLVVAVFGFRTVGMLSSDVDPVIALIIIALTSWSLYSGYRRYIRMPHSLGVVIASQTIAVLTTGMIECGLTSQLDRTLFVRILQVLYP